MGQIRPPSDGGPPAAQGLMTLSPEGAALCALWESQSLLSLPVSSTSQCPPLGRWSTDLVDGGGLAGGMEEGCPVGLNPDCS